MDFSPQTHPYIGRSSRHSTYRSTPPPGLHTVKNLQRFSASLTSPMKEMGNLALLMHCSAKNSRVSTTVLYDFLCCSWTNFSLSPPCRKVCHTFLNGEASLPCQSILYDTTLMLKCSVPSCYHFEKN